MDPDNYGVLGEHIVAPFVTVAKNDDLDAAFDSLRPWLALYIGGMGAKGKNFYNDYATRLGYGEVAERIQDLYLSGEKAEAESLVPNELLDAVSLVGPADRIRERLQVWKEAGKRGEVGSMLLGIADPEVLELIASEML
jgi:alkanesulfonate monooxygenase SsuD/methylene tetrahydromethanopterin reductase-like flavin-dependent oxidoreductase (luciferase family)